MALNATEVHTTHRHFYVVTAEMMSLQTAPWLRVVVCNRLVFFSSSEVYCTDSQQIRPNKQHLSEAAPHMTFDSSKNTCDHRRTKQLFLLFQFSVRLLCLTSFYSVELMLTCFFFFFDVVVIALALEGREEVKVIIVDGDQRVGHVTFFFYRTVQEAKSIWVLPLFQQTWCLVFTRCRTCC